jgi:hypothetical protein
MRLLDDEEEVEARAPDWEEEEEEVVEDGEEVDAGSEGLETTARDWLSASPWRDADWPVVVEPWWACEVEEEEGQERGVEEEEVDDEERGVEEVGEGVDVGPWRTVACETSEGAGWEGVRCVSFRTSWFCMRVRWG